jgi:hypothetical protein
MTFFFFFLNKKKKEDDITKANNDASKNWHPTNRDVYTLLGFRLQYMCICLAI